MCQVWSSIGQYIRNGLVKFVGITLRKTRALLLSVFSRIFAFTSLVAASAFVAEKC
jgi:hypothetical protein